uniref:F-box/WD repeat-containing protein n=1 Tax=Endozoicomonas sp. SESOKO4 TaxID=2828745 RepID=UPI002147470E
MDPANSNFSIDASLSSTPKRPRLEGPSTAVSLGRGVRVQDNIEPAFFHLPEEIHFKIIRYLEFRDITRVTEVCTYLRDLVKDNKALERAWFRRFPSPCQYQLKTIAMTKNRQQLRGWLKPFASRDTVESLLEQRKCNYFPALLLFTNSKLMSQCETFKLVKKARMSQKRHITKATFSTDSCHVLTRNMGREVKIYGQKTGGSWEEKTTISHDKYISSATFSPDNRHVLTACYAGKAKICELGDDGSWEVKTAISHRYLLRSANFSADGDHVVTASDDGVKIYGHG